MSEITFATGIAKLVQEYGVIGVVIAFALLFFLYDKRQRQKDDDDRKERKQVSDADRLMWTNHLSVMIKDSADSNQALALAVNKLAENLQSSQNDCREIRRDFEHQVDRLKKG